MLLIDYATTFTHTGFNMLQDISTADLLDELRRRITSENKLHFETIVSSKPDGYVKRIPVIKPPAIKEPEVDAATQKYLDSIY